MTSRLRMLVLGVLVAIISGLAVLPANATLNFFTLHDHPNGTQVPPTYGLRLDDLVGNGEFTFSFDYPGALMTMTWDDVTNELHIYGTAYGGKDNGAAWDPVLKGWIQIDYYYKDNVFTQDDCAGNPGNDAIVTGESGNNAGTITLVGWGGDGVYNFTDKADGSGCTFHFDNDADSKGNGAIAGDPSIWSGWGWVMPPTNGSRDWLFTAVMMTVPVEERSWGSVKSLYSN